MRLFSVGGVALTEEGILGADKVDTSRVDLMQLRRNGEGLRAAGIGHECFAQEKWKIFDELTSTQ